MASRWLAPAAVLALILLPVGCGPADDGAPAGEGAEDRRARGEGRRGGARAGGGGPRAELAASVAERTGQSQEEARAAVDALFDEMSERLAAGEDVRTGDFGTFSVVRRAARRGESPETGAAVEVPERTAVRFRPGKALRDAVEDAPAELAPRPAGRGAADEAEANEGGEGG